MIYLLLLFDSYKSKWFSTLSNHNNGLLHTMCKLAGFFTRIWINSRLGNSFTLSSYPENENFVHFILNVLPQVFSSNNLLNIRISCTILFGQFLIWSDGQASIFSCYTRHSQYLLDTFFMIRKHAAFSIFYSIF